MNTRTIYSRAPITEAIIDFRIILPSDFRVDEFKRIHDLIKTDYPLIQEQFERQIRLNARENSQPEATSIRNGFRFINNAKTNVFQARLNGFTFSRLSPYERWESFRDEAKRLWDLYSDCCKPQAAIRAAIRFINRLDIPGPKVEIREYLKVFPEVPSDLANNVSGLVMQLQLPQPDLKSILVLNQALVPPARPDTVSVLIDFDLFSEQLWQLNNDGIWKFIEDLHLRADQVFESSITAKTKEMIK